MLRPTLVATVVVIAALGATDAAAQPTADPRPGITQDAVDAYGEMLRRTDSDAHARYVRLRQAREASLADLMRAQDRYRAAGPELRVVSLPQLRAARRKYVADALAFLDFLDERDRKALEQYRAAIEQINGVLAERARSREEIQGLTKE